MKRNQYDPGFEPPEVIARPRCPACQGRLRPFIHDQWARDHSAVGFEMRVTSRRWLGDYYSYGAFCSLRCCNTFANAALKAGYRMRGS